MEMIEVEFKTKKSWIQDEFRKYLWIHDSLPIQVMIFSNDDDSDIKCLWIKTLHGEDFVSNYFVFSLDKEKKHPLDLAIDFVEKFKECEEEA